MEIPQKEIAQFQKKILDWYEKNKRDLPWRDTRDPYRILISELMSQQTQILRVIPKYHAWFEEFPTIQDLAKATVSDVLRLWSGLGYNRRALNLKKAAEIINSEYHGEFPQIEKELLVLPGIGKYTAGAVLCFAFNQQVAVVDTNIRKVILTQFLDCRAPSSLAMTDSQIREIAEQLLPKGKAYEWNQALMDYAAAVLKKEKISIPKQSKFIGSHRYYRGQVLKTLLVKNRIALAEIGPLIKKDYKETEQEWLEKLVEALIHEGFVVNKDGFLFLAS